MQTQEVEMRQRRRTDQQNVDAGQKQESDKRQPFLAFLIVAPRRAWTDFGSLGEEH